MLVSPTGSGKTLTATHIIRDAVTRGKRVLFIIHREPLVNKTLSTLHNYEVESVGYIKAGYPHANDVDRVIVASIQTLARRDYPDNIDLVVFDETHTTSFWKTAQKLIYSVS
ncbi:MAG: DEAD/DEAH box helicase family protein [Crocosphaera sp.]|nr:DEAD/DEAH box helicase family protein [Crocosphaera sp.]